MNKLNQITTMAEYEEWKAEWKADWEARKSDRQYERYLIYVQYLATKPGMTQSRFDKIEKRLAEERNIPMEFRMLVKIPSLWQKLVAFLAPL